jgi:hypothetical protein
MDIFNSVFCPDSVLNEQFAQQIFAAAPEQGIIIMIMDKESNVWLRNYEEYDRLNIDQQLLKELCARIDDGDEPVVTAANNYSIIAAQLVTEHNNYGYVFVILPQPGPQSSVINVSLGEMLLNQFSQIAKLIENKNHLSNVHNQQFGIYNSSEVALN